MKPPNNKLCIRPVLSIRGFSNVTSTNNWSLLTHSLTLNGIIHDVANTQISW